MPDADLSPNSIANRPPLADDEFYVGYLPSPRKLATLLRWATPILLALVVAVAWTVARSQNNPGDGIWHDELQTLVGRISAEPYPLIRVPATRAGSAPETILLISEGKHGAREQVAAFDGHIAKVRGTLLERDGLRLLELAESDALTADTSRSESQAAELALPGPTLIGSVTLSGEIIDPKCYSGAMKPGEGKTHKECATLCIAGGIPPMFVTIDSAGAHSYYLLVDHSGAALRGSTLRDELLPFVADAVEIRGTLERRADLRLLRIDQKGVRRL